jgi:hypothetical protein
MSKRLAQALSSAALLAAGLATVGGGVAHADTTRPVSVAPPGDHDGHGGYRHYHHYHPNCNNDPESGFAMSDECPPSNNDPSNYDGRDDTGPDY